MKKTVLEYTTNTYQEDIPKQFLQEAKIRLNSFFSEQECVQKKGIQFIFKYAFYSVENPRKVTKQHLIKEYARLPSHILYVIYSDDFVAGTPTYTVDRCL